MLSKFPTYVDEDNYPTEEGQIELIKEAVRALRNLRSQMNVPPSRKAKCFVVSIDASTRSIFESGQAYICALAGASEVAVQSAKEGIEDNAVSVVVPGAEIFMPLADLVDFAKERERLNKEITKLQGEVDRVASKLNNQGFMSKAPQAVVDEERAKETKYREMLAAVQMQLEAMEN